MNEPSTGVAEGADVRGETKRGDRHVAADRAAALLDPVGGGGAELRGHVPARPRGVVLVLHGGAESGRAPVAWWRLAVLRMVPFAAAVERGAGGRVAVLRLKNRVRGWNGSRQDPVHDARWALDRIRHVLPGVPIVLVGHSMGGRVALRMAAEPGVVGVAALAPWVESDVVAARPDTPVLLVHGSRDRVTDPRRTAVLASRLYDRGVDVRSVTMDGDTHAMLRDAGAWHRIVRDFVIEVLDDRGRTS